MVPVPSKSTTSSERKKITPHRKHALPTSISGTLAGPSKEVLIRGRDEVAMDEDDDGVGLILAASWLREGRRPAPGAFSVSGMMVQRREGLHSNSDLSIDLISNDAVIAPLLSPEVKLLEQKEKTKVIARLYGMKIEIQCSLESQNNVRRKKIKALNSK